MSNGIWGRLEWQGLFRTSFSVVSKTTEDKEQQSTRTTTKEREEERENLFSLRNHHQKLEEDNKNLSLDPQRNHQYHHQLHHHHQTHPHQEENEEEEEDREEEEEQQQEEEDLTHQHPHLHLHQQEQGFHGFYQLHQPTSLNQHQNPNLIYGRIPVSVSEEPLLLNTQNPQKKRSYFPSSSSSSPTFKNEYARLGDQKMEETQQPSSRLGVVRGGRGGGGGGEIIEVQGGHIIRSTGRKDRHSKVCTAKGPRDRRVRLSAHTAIQFYDVQDRLGYDRPSKAVDWLIKKAKASIDELAELPPWRPTASTVKSSEQQRDEENNQMGIEENASQFVFQHQEQNNNNNTNFLPPSLDSDSIADTIKSFFPMAAAQSGSVSSSSSIHFQNYQTPPDLLSRTSSQTQDLRLSLQSFQDPMLLHHNQHHHHHHHHHHQQHHSNPSSSEQALFSTAFDVGGGSASWSDQQMPEMGRFQRILAWNPNTDSSGVGGGGGGFIFNSPPPPQQPPPSLPVFSGQNPLFSQRGPLQSSNSPSIRAWNIDPSMITPTDHYQNLNTIHHHQSSSISGTGFTTSGFSGFRIPARIQGEEEEHDAAATSNNQQQSSASRQ